MNRGEVDKLKQQVACGAVLERAGFAVDVKESTRRAVKWRRGGDIIIVTHEGRGWFDPLSDDKGDVFSLLEHLERATFIEAVELVAELVGYRPVNETWMRPARPRCLDISVSDRWDARRKPWRGSATWTYLTQERFLSPSVLYAAIRKNTLREGPYGSMWAAHTNDAGIVTGWEERGLQWRGYSTGGAKILFRLGDGGATRLCITEAAIDAMSLASFEGMRDGSLYFSTGGGWSPATEAALHRLAKRQDALLVAATDNNQQGEVFATRLRLLADEAGCDWQRLKPAGDDWNAALQIREKEKKERRMTGRRGLPHARLPRQG